MGRGPAVPVTCGTRAPGRPRLPLHGPRARRPGAPGGLPTPGSAGRTAGIRLPLPGSPRRMHALVGAGRTDRGPPSRRLLPTPEAGAGPEARPPPGRAGTVMTRREPPPRCCHARVPAGEHFLRRCAGGARVRADLAAPGRRSIDGSGTRPGLPAWLSRRGGRCRGPGTGTVAPQALCTGPALPRSRGSPAPGASRRRPWGRDGRAAAPAPPQLQRGDRRPGPRPGSRGRRAAAPPRLQHGDRGRVRRGRRPDLRKAGVPMPHTSPRPALTSNLTAAVPAL